ncbi:glyoxylase-like metal-dependent hydrolase (beta-lactamase superfamily II) [Catenulispora sp. GAS73]|uniref:MBL fold metallo-hydrolase n=1 Tax=Catenulispora sp. GAS73 TaxID=3156269 RepID=UPI0035198743
MNALQYDVSVSGLEPVAGASLPDGTTANWSPLAHTLVYGAREAAVVDPPITRGQATALADWIAAHERELTHIYITHWHGDHWFGTAELLRRFPHATVLAGGETRRRLRESVADGKVPALWTSLFGERLSDGAELAAAAAAVEQVPADGFEIDGHQLVSIEVGHSDTDDSTVLHVPSLGLVAAGDVVYNNVHQYLAETPNGGLEAWHRALDLVAALEPRHVVAGHKDARRPDAVSDIDETHRYLDATSTLLGNNPTRAEFLAQVLELYPNRVNPYTIWLSAGRLLAD